MESFIALVHQQLKAHNMTVAKLAKKVKLSPQYIHELLKGKRRWNETTLHLICKELCISIEFKAN